jgi:diaminopimelate decarboxylase
MLTRDGSGAATLGAQRLSDLLDRERLPTPAYVYDVDGIVREAVALSKGFGELDHLVAYAVKANSAGPILRALALAGVGADVVSGAELELALACGVAPDRIVMSGVGKTDPELDLAMAAGTRGILSIHVESIEEISRIEARARALSRRARVSLRINPGIEADTHAYIATGHDEAKFGIPRAEVGLAMEVLEHAPSVDLVGVSSHIGSQLTETSSYLTAARMLVDVARGVEAALAGAGRPPLELVDFGGGFGIDYGSGCAAKPADFASELSQLVRAVGRTDRRTVVEPGRALVAAHGVLCASVIGTKRARPNEDERRWLIIDAGMNDLLRPALYQAVHRIEPLDGWPPSESKGVEMRVVGPVCESSDDFGTHRMPEVAPARVVIRDTGAYGFTMASEYNGRSMPIEVFLSDGRVVDVLRPRSSNEWVRARLGGERA